MWSALEQKGWPEDFELIRKLMSPPPAITSLAGPGTFKGVRVGVIGGGLAGLAAAFELRKLGFEITIYDAIDDRIGGRVYTYHFDTEKNLYHEFGAMRIPVSHETVWHYINTFHLPTRTFVQNNPNAFIYLKKTQVRNDPNGYNVMRYIYPHYQLADWERELSWQKLWSLGLDGPLRSATTSERAETIQVKQYYSNKALLWSDSTNFQIMQASGLSQDAVSLVANFQPLLYGNLYNSYIDYIQEEYPANTTFLYEIPGGMTRLPMAFYHSFSSADPYPGIPSSALGTIRYQGGYWVDTIDFENDRNKIRLQYKHLKSNQAYEEEFDYVVCAIPFSTLRTLDINPLFSNIKMRAIREVHYTAAQKSLMLCKERFWERAGIVGGGSFTDLPIASVWYPSDHLAYLNRSANFAENYENIPVNEPGVIIGSFNFGLDTTRLTSQAEEDIFEENKREIEEVHGLPRGYLNTIAEGYKTVNWDTEPAIRGALSFFSPEQKKFFSYGMTVPEFNGKIFFAGEHISPVHRWMQGALQTGMQAANDLTLACKNSG
jgi:Monoamine oxidase